MSPLHTGMYITSMAFKIQAVLYMQKLQSCVSILEYALYQMGTQVASQFPTNYHASNCCINRCEYSVSTWDSYWLWPLRAEGPISMCPQPPVLFSYTCSLLHYGKKRDLNPEGTGQFSEQMVGTIAYCSLLQLAVIGNCRTGTHSGICQLHSIT